MNERLVEIRKALQMNQKKFAESISIGQSTLAMIEVGKRALNDRHIKLICNIYNVNEEWLRNGNGEMFISKNQEEELASYINRISIANSFKKRLMMVLASLSETEWEVLEDVALRIMANHLLNFSEDENNSEERKQLHKELDRQLDLEKTKELKAYLNTRSNEDTA